MEGAGLALETRLASVPPLPSRLAGSRVLVDGVECALLMVSPSTIYAQVPFGTVSKKEDGSVTVTVMNRLGEVSTSARLGVTSPVLLTQSRDGKGTAVMVDERLRPVYSPKAGDVVIVYVMGLGETTPGGATGLAMSSPDRRRRTRRWRSSSAISRQRCSTSGWRRGLAATYQIKLRIPEGGGDTVLVRTEGTHETSARVPGCATGR